MVEEAIRPWLVVDDSEDSREAEGLFKQWCDRYGQECTVFGHDQIADYLDAPTLIWMGKYEGLYLIRRVLKVDPNNRYGPITLSSRDQPST